MNDIREIVAAKINGSIITNNLREIIDAAKQHKVSAFYERDIIKFMASCDLGKHWENLSESKTLFYIVDGKPMFQLPKN